MEKVPAFDLDAAHKYFAAHCFNSAWVLIDKVDRTPEDNLQLVALNQASLFHWRNRPDCSAENLSVGYWQASRIQALLGNASEAKRYAEVCLNYSAGLEPFYVGYAYEALARAAVIANAFKDAKQQVSLARNQAVLVTKEDHRALLLKDIELLELDVHNDV